MRVLMPSILSEGKTGKGFFLIRLKKALKVLGVKIVHSPTESHAVYLDVIKFRMATKRAKILRVDGVYCDRGQDARRNKVIRDAMRQADGIVFQSEFCMEAARRLFTSEDLARPCQVIHNGANPKYFAKGHAASSEYKYNFLAVGRWRRHKRLREIVRSFAAWNNSNACLWVAGDKDYKLCHPRIRYIGRITQEKLARYYRLCDALVHISWIDWCPNAVVESLCAGTPVICNNVGGNPELVRKSGVICEIDKPYDWSNINPACPPSVNGAKLVAAYKRVVDSKIVVDRPDLHIETIAKKYLAFFKRIRRKHNAR